MPKPPPHWIPFLGPLIAALAGGAAGALLWRADFWVVLGIALASGFIPIVAYRLWKWSHHKRD